MKIYNKRKAVTALIAIAVCVACLIACFTTSREPRFIIAFFLALVYAGIDCYGALSKKMYSEESELCSDERDIYISMKTSQTSLRILSCLLLVACITSIIVYAALRSPASFTVVVTLCIISSALFPVLFFTNLYYEKHN